MTTKQELEASVANAKAALETAEAALQAFSDAPENNRFDDLQVALDTVEDDLRSQAYDDCQGAYNCGDDSYSKEFYVGDTLYRGTAEFEYNRHDKTYYYIDECNFTYEEVK
jgi:hypothetical protein